MSQGLWVAFLGMTMVFLALGVLLVTIMLLDRAFRPRPVSTAPDVTSEGSPMDVLQEDKALAAAVGLAVALAGSKQASGISRPSAPSTWRLQGRRQQMGPSSKGW